jgi:DNA-binding transcriptional ArsR family regulator
MLLAALGLPATTTQLAGQLGLSPAAVSEHLKVLKDTTLVTAPQWAAGAVPTHRSSHRAAGDDPARRGGRVAASRADRRSPTRALLHLAITALDDGARSRTRQMAVASSLRWSGPPSGLRVGDLSGPHLPHQLGRAAIIQ